MNYQALESEIVFAVISSLSLLLPLFILQHIRITTTTTISDNLVTGMLPGVSKIQ